MNVVECHHSGLLTNRSLASIAIDKQGLDVCRSERRGAFARDLIADDTDTLPCDEKGAARRERPPENECEDPSHQFQ